MIDPLTTIEDHKGQTDLGVTAYRIFNGAQAEGASFWEATAIVFAWFRGAMHPPKDDA